MISGVEKGRKNYRKATSEWTRSLNYSQKQRLRYFEARLLWEGQVNRKSICEQFGVTANHFTREVTAYKRYLPGNIWYDVSSRAYRPTPEFRTEFTSGNPEEYLSLLRLYSQNESPSLLAELGVSVNSASVSESQEKVDRHVLQAVLTAIRTGEGIEVLYQSFSRDTPSTRVIWPHALVWTGERWHARSYDEKRLAYIDIVLSRITNVTQSDIPAQEKIGEDADWIEWEAIDVIPNPDLSIHQQKAVAMEYGMEEVGDQFIWSTKMRRCLIPYFLYRHRLDVDPSIRKRHGFPTQRIVTRDSDTIAKYAFPSD